MNICIEAQLLNHPRRSGLMTYTESLVNGMSRIDQENDYALAYYSLKRKPEEMPGPENGNFRKAVVKVPDREFVGRQAVIDQIFLPWFLKKNKVKVFHRPAGYTMPAGNGIFKILTVHDLRTLTIGDRFWTQNIAQYKRTLSQVDICVVISQCTKKDLVEHFQMDEHKIKVIYLGADERFKPAPENQIKQIRSKYQLNEPFLLSVGSVPRKNIEGIIRGFAASTVRDDYLLVLTCNYDIVKYKFLANNLGVGKRIRILDQLGDEEIVALYSGCHCFVFPSLYEGFGLPILEAMQCGAPVITSNGSSCPEVAGDSAILVNPNEVEEITGAIDQICHDEKLRKEFIEKGFRRAKMFSWQNFAQEMKKVYSMA